MKGDAPNNNPAIANPFKSLDSPIAPKTIAKGAKSIKPGRKT